MVMDLNENARITYEKRYLKRDAQGNVIETPADLLQRVAANIASVEKEYGRTEEEVKQIEEEFLQILTKSLFLPNSPTLMNAGRELQQLSACFVLPLEDSMEGIFDTLKYMALVQKTGGGTGFSFDRLRPKGDMVCSTSGVASGPVSFLKIFDAATEAVKQGGTRRGANMGSLSCYHPDLMEFITCKEKEEDVNNFNISVAVSDEFMRKAVGEDEDPYYTLINPRTKKPHISMETQKEVQLNAKEIFDIIIDKAWKNGDPGIIFIDQMNRFNPTPNIGLYETTNPCFHADTLISTELGLERIEDLYRRAGNTGFVTTVDDRVWEEKQVVNGRQYFVNGVSYKNATVFPTGIRETLLVTLKNGQELKVTPDHRILTADGWKEAGDLQKGDLVLVQSGPGKWALADDIGEELGLLLGWIGGDGWLTSDEITVGLVFSGEETHLLDLFKEITAKFGGGIRKPHQRENGTWQFLFKRKELVDKLKGFGLKAQKAPQKRVPEGLFTAAEKTVCAYLRGLFSSDGTVNYMDEAHRDIRLSSASVRLLQDVQLLLLNLGIMSRIYDRTKKLPSIFRYTTTTGVEKEYTGGQYWELIINGDDLMVFNEMISPLLVRAKQEKLGKIARLSRKKTKFNVEVKSVIPTGERTMVYDVTEEETHSLIAQGMVAHNCGEQPLLPFEACCLGSINLGKLVTPAKEVDWENLRFVVRTSVRFLDNVIDASEYVVEQIARMHKGGNRKIGLGVMGWADMLVRLNIPYDSQEAIETAQEVMGFIDQVARETSVSLAAERDVFPNFAGSTYDTGLEADRVRNATRTTIAPTGTISILGGASSGIEPYFSIAYLRKNVLGGVDLPEVNPLFVEIAKAEGFYSEELLRRIARTGSVQDVEEVPAHIRAIFKTAMEIPVDSHVGHQAAFQKHTNNAVSKTINLKTDATREDVRHSYLSAWRSGCKGITIYRDNSRKSQVLNVGTDQKGDLKPTRRPKTLQGNTTNITTPLGNLFITLNSMEGRPFELFAQIGKAGSDVVAFTEAIARLVSLALRCGVSVDEIVNQLEGIGGARSVGFGPNRIMSVPDAVGRALKDLAKSTHKAEKNGSSLLEICPDCGTGALIRAEGCSKCEACGYSEC